MGAAIATAILVSPIGLFLLFSKKRNHYVTIGYRGADGESQVAVFELGKDIVRTVLPILEKRSGQQIEYQDDEGRNFNRSADRAEDQRAEVVSMPAAKPKAEPQPKSEARPKAGTKKTVKEKEWWEMN